MPAIAQRFLPVILLLLIGGFNLTTAGRAQTLGELARLDRERRASEGKKARKIYTNDDFPLVVVSEARQSQPVHQVARESEPRPKEDQAEVEKTWRQRFAEARARLREAEQRCWQTRIQTVFVGGGGLSGMKSGAAVPVQMQVQECLKTEELRAARKGLADLEEELRRAGLPPGWARE